MDSQTRATRILLRCDRCFLPFLFAWFTCHSLLFRRAQQQRILRFEQWLAAATDLRARSATRPFVRIAPTKLSLSLSLCITDGELCNSASRRRFNKKDLRKV